MLPGGVRRQPGREDRDQRGIIFILKTSKILCGNLTFTIFFFLKKTLARPAASDGGELFAALPLRQPARFQRRLHEGGKFEQSAFLFACSLGAILACIDLNFKLIFQLWHQYDSDGSGSIEADELKVCGVVSLQKRWMF